MATIRYDAIPTAARFKNDSSVRFAIRNHDRILTHLDWLLERYHADHGSNIFRPHVIVCDLFMTANFWIKLYHEGNPKMSKERYPAVLALFESVVNSLAIMFGVAGKSGNFMAAEVQVGKKMLEMFGRDVLPEKKADDFSAERRAIYYTNAERSLHRLRFQGGRAYRHVLRPNQQIDLVPAESRDCYVPAVRPGDAECIPGWGSFVMSYEREFFMSSHTKGIYHSAYMQGGPVCCAGTILIKNGYVRGIRNDSGHYQPGTKHLAFALTALMMYGVNVQQVKVYDYNSYGNGTFHSKGTQGRPFMGTHVTWANYTDQAPISNLRDGGY